MDLAARRGTTVLAALEVAHHGFEGSLRGPVPPFLPGSIADAHNQAVSFWCIIPNFRFSHSARPSSASTLEQRSGCGHKTAAACVADVAETTVDDQAGASTACQGCACARRIAQTMASSVTSGLRASRQSRTAAPSVPSAVARPSGFGICRSAAGTRGPGPG